MLRDENGVAHLVGVSGGKDSTCLALALKEREPRPYTYVYTPTGDELPEMVEHWKRLEELLGPIVSVTGRTLRQTIDEQKALPSFRLRFCTRLIKLAPYGRFIAAAAPAISYIGLRADEEEADRGGATHGGDYITADEAKGVTQRFPLREWGWGIDEVWAFLNERGIEIPERTDCARCPYQKLGEWYNLWMKHPAIYADAEAQESQYGHTFRSPGRDTWPAGLKELRERFEAGNVPQVSLRMMEKRKGMCRVCTL